MGKETRRHTHPPLGYDPICFGCRKSYRELPEICSCGYKAREAYTESILDTPVRVGLPYKLVKVRDL